MRNRSYRKAASSFLVSLVAASALVLAACGGSSSNDGGGGDPPGGGPDDHEGGGGNVPTVDQFCQHFADHVHTCDHNQDAQTIANSCKNNTSAKLPKWLDKVVRDTDKCVQEEDCATALSEQGIQSCIDTAAANVSPSSGTNSFCADYKDAWHVCGDDTIDLARCLNNMKVYKDAALGEAGKCNKKACGQIDACVSAALGLQ